jgi:hypothetical protein
MIGFIGTTFRLVAQYLNRVSPTPYCFGSVSLFKTETQVSVSLNATPCRLQGII